MRRVLSLLVPALLATFAVVLHLPWTSAPALPAIFQQGALTPLVDAESALRLGRHPEAQEAFRLAFMRGFREDQKGVSERIRRRLASAGKQMLEQGIPSGWPYVAASCVLSSDFSHFASEAEQWALDTGLMAPPFPYALTEPSGRSTLWGAGPVKAPFWIYRRLPPGTQLEKWERLLYNVKAGDVPEILDGGAIWNLHLLFSTTAIPTRIEIQPLAHWDGQVYMSFNNLIQWETPPARKAPGVLDVRAPSPQLWGVDRLVTAGSGEQPALGVTLIREYASLE